MFLRLLFLLCCTAPAVYAAPDKDALNKNIKEVEQTIKETEKKNTSLASDLKKTEAEMARLESSTKNLAKKVKDTESKTVTIRARLAELEAQEATIAEEMDKLKKLIAPMIKAGLDLSRKPTDLNLFLEDPAKAHEVLTAHVALKSAAHATQDYLDSYAKAQLELDDVQQDLLAQKAKLDSVVDELSKDRDALAARMKEREKLAATKRGALQEGEKKTQELQAKRQKLVTLLTAIKREEEARRAAQKKARERKKSKPSEKPVKRSEPTLARGLPAAGYVVQRYGEPDPDSGLEARGVTIEGERGGVITAPSDGEVRFTGPFKGFGKLVIIEHNNGDFSLLGGLGKITVSEGQKVGKGAPVGTLSASTSATPRLYYELRRGGSDPVDPMKLF